MKETTVKLMEAIEYSSSLEENFDRSIESFKTILMANQSPMPEELNLFFLSTKSQMLETMATEMTKLYEDNFSEEEIIELTKFYLTPTGKKWLAVAPKAIELAQKVGAEVAQEFLNNIEKHIPSEFTLN